jgi:hypothetical protein
MGQFPPALKMILLADGELTATLRALGKGRSIQTAFIAFRSCPINAR